EDSYIHHNTSDGLDLLYMDGGSNSSVTVRRTHAVGNAGNQLKTLGKTLIENSVVVGNCAYFNGRDSMKSDDQCRALGNAISVGLVGGQDITIRHNTITGQGDCLILSEGGSSTSSLNIQNNALVGQVDWRSNLQGNTGELTCGHYAYNSSAKLTYSGNLFYNVKQGQCPSGSICSDPRLASSAIASFDATPQSGSPLVDKAPYLAAVADDFYGNARPSGGAADIGAIELQAGGGNPPPDPAPTCSRNAPTLQLTDASQSALAGTSLNYVVRVSNNDSSACASTTFTLARSVPGGWSSNLASPTASIAPGQYRDMAVQVTSTSSASAGTYSIGLGVGSNIAVHTVSTVAHYVVTAPTPPPASCARSNPQLTLSGPGTVKPGDTNTYQVSIKNLDSSACSSSTFDIATEVPSGWSQSLSTQRVALSSGGSRTVTLTVTLPDSAATGARQLAARATNAGATSYSTRKSIPVEVQDNDDESPVKPPVVRKAHDFDGDGQSDIFWRHYGGGWNVIWRAADDGNRSQVATVANSHWSIVGEGDFDANGTTDLLWRNASTGANTIWLDGGAERELAVARVTSSEWFVAAVGDFDADGVSDILWRNSQTGANVVWKAGDSTRQMPLASVPRLSWHIQGVGDFNGDGRSDLFWRDSATGRNTIWLSGDASTQQSVTTVSNPAWRVEHVADFNGDGRADLLWRKNGVGNNAIWKSGNESTQMSIAALPDAGWAIAGVGDFDGDGTDDIFWRNASTGDNTIWRSANVNSRMELLAVRDQEWHAELR
ncbi:FG-GAP-like repeat-containing protein, partial [Marilutibacter aestuarii]